MRKVVILIALGWLAPSAHAQDAETVTVEVVSTPRGATVEVLGRGEVGRTPIRRLALPRGEHDFVFTRRGYARTVVHAAVTEDGQRIGAVLERPAVVNVRADHLPARGAHIRVDGQLAGRVPARVEVAPGRRLIEVEAEGFLTFAQWVELEAGQTRSIDVRLEERLPDLGSILVVTDVSGAEVFVDGTSRGHTPRVVEGLTPGEHRVEVVAPSGARVERTVEVRVDAREIVSVELADRPPPPGRASVVSEPPGATVLVDGEPRGVTPIVIEGLSPGPHIFDLSLEGFVNEQRVVTVEPSAEIEVSVTLSRGEPRPGRIVVRANREDAFVIVDGLSRGRAPISLEHVRPGRHSVRLVAEGVAPYEAECVITYGETCTIDARLEPPPIAVRVVATDGAERVDGARLFVDGEEVGPLPWDGALAVGTHELEARTDDLEPARRTVEITAGMAPVYIALTFTRPPEAPARAVEEETLAPEEEVPPERPLPAREIAFVPRAGAEALASGAGYVAFSAGWPYLLGAEIGVGLPGPADLGVALRTFGRLTELTVSTRVGARVLEFLALGALLRLSAGVGPDDVNSFLGRLDGRVTFLPIRELGLSLWLGVDLSTDDYPFVETDASTRLAAVGRQDLARARLGGAVDVRVTPEWSIGVRVEGVLGSSAGRRRIFGDVLELGNEDTQVYGDVAAVYSW
ncbi:MAG TPA: PEGA domain-containing protein [Sandaracinaceae bacterium]